MRRGKEEERGESGMRSREREKTERERDKSDKKLRYIPTILVHYH